MILRIDFADRVSVTSGVTNICIRKMLRAKDGYTHDISIAAQGQHVQELPLKDGDTIITLNENTNDLISCQVIEGGIIQDVEDEA